MKKHILKYIPLLLVSLTLLLLIVSLTVWCPNIQPAKETKILNEQGDSLTAISISDLKKLNRIEYANYTPNEFVYPQSFLGEKIQLSQTSLAPKGTLTFVFLNLDPEDPDFSQKSAELKPYLEGDKRWHFTLYLPAFFSSANIYVRSVLSKRIGQIENYDFINFSEYEGKTEYHKSTTQPQYLDLGFYSLKRALDPSLEIRGLVVTIHYEANTNQFVGFKDYPVIGKDENILSMTNVDTIFLISISILSMLVAAILAFTCFTKKHLSILPYIIINLGISGYALGILLLNNFTTTPYLILAILPICSSIIILGVLLSNRVSFRKFPLWISFLLLTLVFSIIMTILYILPYRQSYGLEIIFKILTILIIISILFSSLHGYLKDKNPNRLLIPGITIIYLIFMVFINFSSPKIHSIPLWLLVLILGITTISAFLFFIQLEQRNRYLTNNLQIEVSKQTQSLKGILEERDKLLRYLSHDMKKPVASIKRFVSDLSYQEKNNDRSKKYQIVLDKLAHVEEDLTDLQKYAKHTYNKEASSALNITEIISICYENLNPDCEANNIRLHCNLKQNIYAFAKKETLLSVLNNLIMNAIEHSSCSNIYIKTTKNISKGLCKIQIEDDGIGINNSIEAIEPYHSLDHQKENLGLGLYICKDHLATMDGTLEYFRENNKTIFTILLHLA